MVGLRSLGLWSRTARVVSYNDYIYSLATHEPTHIRSLSAFPTTFVPIVINRYVSTGLVNHG